MEVFNFCKTNLGSSNEFPCNANSIIAVSVGIGCGVLSLLFVVFLMRTVRIIGVAGETGDDRMSRLKRLSLMNLY
jgi:hypothetical protein